MVSAEDLCDMCLMEARRVDGVRTPRSGHHEEDGLDRGFIREPPLLGLEVVAGAALLVFGHRFVLCGWLCVAGLVAGSLPKRAVSARWQRFGRKKRSALMLWYMSTATSSLELRKAGMRAYTA